MFSPGDGPLRVKSMEIANVKRIEDTFMRSGERQLFLIRCFDEPGVQSRDHRNTTRTENRDKIAVYRVFIDVDLDLAHWRGSAPVLFLKGLRLPRLRFEIRVDFRKGWRNNRREPHVPAPATGGQTSSRFLPE